MLAAPDQHRIVLVGLQGIVGRVQLVTVYLIVAIIQHVDVQPVDHNAAQLGPRIIVAAQLSHPVEALYLVDDVLVLGDGATQLTDGRLARFNGLGLGEQSLGLS